jgi:hypothetical protein
LKQKCLMKIRINIHPRLQDGPNITEKEEKIEGYQGHTGRVCKNIMLRARLMGRFG